MMSEQFKPCPFCGSGRASNNSGMAGFSGVSLEEVEFLSSPGYYINCSTCGGQGGIEHTEDKAIEVWNKRIKVDYD